MIRKIFKLLLWIIGIFVIAFVSLLAFSTITDYSPEAESEESLSFSKSNFQKIQKDTLSILIWNIGYCGLGAEMDFFNDGGKSVRASEEQSAKYLKAISGFLRMMKDSVDFAMLQEIDRNSKRSYFIDQVPIIEQVLKGFGSVFALNYDVKFVPVPFGLPYTPYGKTFGGLVTYSRFEPKSSTRVQYPGGFSWPTKLYMLDRCALEQRFDLPNGKELVLVNTHNTAYDETGEIKKIELSFMKKRYEVESSKGNFVIIGGDWNQVPPGFSATYFSKNISNGYTPQSLSKELIPADFKVSYDSSNATNRSNIAPFDQEKTYTTLIDYFMSSPNVKVLSVRIIDMNFRYSDHQPVLLKVALK
jgi:endonuclease/exonuclease/phosphatase family metal-dependent hydrolase